jgi:hypothetical protein
MRDLLADTSHLASWGQTKYKHDSYCQKEPSTALSPTDTPVLRRWAKVLMMVQSVISLLILVLLAARAVNIL